jgi:D-3-phosphoglycerate dehydrogenase
MAPNMAPKVLISDALSPAAVAIFKDRGIEVDFQPNLGKDKDKLAETINGFDGLAIRSATKVTAKMLEQAKSLKVIGRAGIGVDNVDIPAATARGIIVMNTPFGNSITTAEHAITLMLSLARQIPEADASTRAGKWEKNKFLGMEIFSKTLGIIGCGNIGSIVADRAIGLKMKVIAYDPYLSAERAVRSRCRESKPRGTVTARRFRDAAYSAHRQDPQHHQRRQLGIDEEGRSADQLCARRADRRSRFVRGA